MPFDKAHFSAIFTKFVKIIRLLRMEMSSNENPWFKTIFMQLYSIIQLYNTYTLEIFFSFGNVFVTYW